MYTSEQYQALSHNNFDFTHFDYVKAKETYKAYMKWARTDRSWRTCPYMDARALHVTRSLYRRTPIEKIETPNTRQPIRPHDIKWCIEYFRLEENYEDA